MTLKKKTNLSLFTLKISLETYSLDSLKFQSLFDFLAVWIKYSKYQDFFQFLLHIFLKFFVFCNTVNFLICSNRQLDQYMILDSNNSYWKELQSDKALFFWIYLLQSPLARFFWHIKTQIFITNFELFIAQCLWYYLLRIYILNYY